MWGEHHELAYLEFERQQRIQRLQQRTQQRTQRMRDVLRRAHIQHAASQHPLLQTLGAAAVSYMYGFRPCHMILLPPGFRKTLLIIIIIIIVSNKLAEACKTPHFLSHRGRHVDPRH